MAWHLSHLSRSLFWGEWLKDNRLGEIVNRQTQAARLGIPRPPPLQSLLCPSLTFYTDRRAYSDVITQFFPIDKFPVSIAMEVPQRALHACRGSTIQRTHRRIMISVKNAQLQKIMYYLTKLIYPADFGGLMIMIMKLRCNWVRLPSNN